MCGRYVSVAERTDLIELYDATSAESSTASASYNVAPTQNVTAVIERLTSSDDDGVQRSLRLLKWGLVPFWANDPKVGSRMINARVETLAEKPAFRQAFAKRRTVLPANGYYEWAPEEIDGKIRKQPYYIHPAEDGVLSLAGLYELWADPSKDKDDPERLASDGHDHHHGRHRTRGRDPRPHPTNPAYGAHRRVAGPAADPPG